MEKKKLHRIVGVLILIAIVIIILPFVTGKNDLAENKTLTVDAPPFPKNEPSSDNPPLNTSSAAISDESSEIEKSPPFNETQLNQQPALRTQADGPVISLPSNSLSETAEASVLDNKTSLPLVQTSREEVLMQPKEVASIQKSAIQQPAIQQPAIQQPAIQQPAIQQPAIQQPAVIAMQQPKAALPSKNQFKPPLKRVAWVVQMGHFRQTVNATRLTHRLKNLGYKAFTRQVVSPNGVMSTRVYVGPEYAQDSARKTLGDIRHQIHLDGLVVPFEPLSL